MKNDDSCCKGGSNKNFKGSKCQCMEEFDDKEVIEVEESSGCCGGHGMKEEKSASCGSGGCGCC